MLLADADDAVLLQRRPSTAHLRRLQSVGLSVPQIALYSGSLTGHALTRRTLGALQPWGESPASAALLAPLGARPWVPRRAAWHRKSTALPVLRSVLGADWLAGPETVGVRCVDLPAVEAAIQGAVIIKAELSAAGRGAIRVTETLSASQRGWLARTLRQQGAVVVEPLLPRILDLSFHFNLTDDGARLVGMTRFFTDRRGQYLGHWLSRLADGLPSELVRWLHGDGRDAGRMRRLATQIGAQCAAALSDYRGPLGVDALVYRDGAQLKLKPVVELNPRWSMGRVALALRGRIANRTPAVFALLGRPMLSALGLSAPEHFAELLEEHPLKLDGGGQIRSGLVPLTEPQPDSRVVAVLAAGAAADAIMAVMPEERSL